MAAWSWPAVASGNAGTGFTSTGSASFGANTDALFLKLWSGELNQYFDHKQVVSQYIREKTIRGGFSYQFPFYGHVKSADRTPGMNYLVNADGGSSLMFAPKKIERVVFLDKPRGLSSAIDITDEMKAPEGALARQAVSRTAVDQLAFTKTMRQISTLIAAASMPDSALSVGIDTKTTAGTKAGISDGPAGLDINSALLTSGAAAEEESQKAKLFLDYLHAPESGRYVLIDPRIAKAIVKDSGQFTSFWTASAGGGNLADVSGSGATAITKNNPSRMLNRDFGGAGSYYEMMLPPTLSGFRPILCPYLSQFGTLMETVFGDPLDAAGAGLGKYMPNAFDGFAKTVAGLSGASDPGGGVIFRTNGTDPKSWKDAGNTPRMKNYLDNVGMIFFQEEAIGTVNLLGLDVDIAWSRELRAWTLIAEYTCGHGCLWPELVMVAATAKAT